jgi:hypothetical protein
MALFDINKLGASLMASMGVSPDQVRAFVVTVLQEVADMKADRLAFKPASQRAYRDVVERLERMERNQATLMRHFGLETEQRTETDGRSEHGGGHGEPDSGGALAINGHAPAPAPAGTA